MELDERELKRLKELVPYKILSPTPDEICEEIERLHSIIKEVREYIENKEFINYKNGLGNFERMLKHRQEILEILDKENMK